MGKVSRRAILAAGAAAGAAAVGGAFFLKVSRRRPKNLVLIMADALRQDRLGMKGPGGRSLTPFLDSAGLTGTVFTNCIAASSWTLPSVAAFFTSRVPVVAGQYYSEGFASDAITVTQALRSAGYDTLAVVKNPWLPARTATGELLPTVITRGFDYYDVRGFVMEPNPLFAQGIGQEKEFVSFPPAEEAVDKAVSVLKARKGGDKRPFFLYLHLMNTHEPYSPSSAHRGLADAAPPVEGIPDHLLFKVIRHRGKTRGAEMLSGEDAPIMARAKALYDAATASTDAAVARLAEYLEGVGAAEDTIFVFTADHGEEFGEHRWFGHAVTLYQEVLRVPLVMWGAGVASGLRVDTASSAIDVAPEMLRVARLPELGSAEGEALAAGAGLAAREAVSCTVFPALPQKLESVTVSLIDCEGRKVIRKRRADAPDKAELEVFDLNADPGETTNVAAGSAEAAASITKRMDQYAANAARRPSVPALTLDDEARKQLKSVGYLN